MNADNIEQPLNEVLSKMPADDQELVRLYVVNNLTCSEIAKARHRHLTEVRNLITGFYKSMLRAI